MTQPSTFPLGRVPDPDDYDPAIVEEVRAKMAAERKAVAPNPLAQALYPILPTYRPKR